MKIGVLQPHIPHYREAFFKGIEEKYNCDLLCYQDQEYTKNNNFKDAEVKTIKIKSIEKYGFMWCNPFVFKKYDVLILMLHFGHLTSWLLLLTKFIHRKRIILWGQGISVKRYLNEEQDPSRLLKWMIARADVVWFYTEKEKQQWQKIFPKKEMVALNNTISGIESIVSYKSTQSKRKLKEKYAITQSVCFIFCARFNNNYRRQDLLLEVIERLDTNRFGFIIIGSGEAKPDFSGHNNVYDYGAVYDVSKKQDLFTMADLYIQLGWVGLSVVEALGYGKPIITFKRGYEVLQCVEYYYLENNKNALIFTNTDDLISKIKSISFDEIRDLQKNAKEYVVKNLMMEHMVKQALKTIKKIIKYEGCSFFNIHR